MINHHSFTLTLVLSVICLVPEGSEGLARVQIRLSKYINHFAQVHMRTHGLGCCDSATTDISACPLDGCSPVFDICVTDGTHKDKCTHFLGTTDVFPNASEVVFPAASHNIKNPISFSIPIWDGAIYIKVNVSDGGQMPPEPMVTLSTQYTLSTPDQFGQIRWTAHAVEVYGVRLEMDVSIACENHFRDRTCTCEDVNITSEHTMCNRDGGRVCLEGWADMPKCLTPTITCARNLCQNGGTCGTYKDAHNKETTVCTCPPSFSGDHCEIILEPTTTVSPRPTTIRVRTSSTATVSNLQQTVSTSHSTVSLSHSTVSLPHSIVSLSQSTLGNSQNGVSSAQNAVSNPQGSTTTTAVTDSGGGGSAGLVAGVVVGVAALLGVASGLLYFLFRRWKRKRTAVTECEQNLPDETTHNDNPEKASNDIVEDSKEEDIPQEEPDRNDAFPENVD